MRSFHPVLTLWMVRSEIGHPGGMPNCYGLPEVQGCSQKGSRPESTSEKYSVDRQFGIGKKHVLKRCKTPCVPQHFRFVPLVST